MDFWSVWYGTWGWFWLGISREIKSLTPVAPPGKRSRVANKVRHLSKILLLFQKLLVNSKRSPPIFPKLLAMWSAWAMVFNHPFQRHYLSLPRKKMFELWMLRRAQLRSSLTTTNITGTDEYLKSCHGYKGISKQVLRGTIGTERVI